MPWERIHTDIPPLATYTCRVCSALIQPTEVAAGEIVVRLGAAYPYYRHITCGGPPVAEFPPKKPRKESGQAGASGNEQGRVIRKGNSLS